MMIKLFGRSTVNHPTINTSALLQILAVAVGYYLLAKLGLFLKLELTNASPVWPAAGFAIVVLFRFGFRAAIGIFLGSLAANIEVLSSMASGISLNIIIVALLNGLGATLEALCCKYLLIKNHTQLRILFNHVKHIINLVLFAGASCVISASLGVLGTLFTSPSSPVHFSEVWATWYLGDLAGILLITPFLTSIFYWKETNIHNSDQDISVESLFILALFVVFNVTLFSNQFSANLTAPLTFASFVFIIWSAFRASIKQTTLMIFYAGVQSTYATAMNTGPLVNLESNLAFLIIQVYVSTLSVIGNLLIATLTDRTLTHNRLNEAYKNLDEHVKQRTFQLNDTLEELRESERKLKTMIENAPEAILVIDSDTDHFTEANEHALELFGLSRTNFRNISPTDISPRKQASGELSYLSLRKYINLTLSGEKPVFEWSFENSAKEEIMCEVRLVKLPSANRNLIRVSVTDIREKKKADTLAKLENNILASIAHRAPLTGILNSICQLLENYIPGSIVVFLKFDVVNSHLAYLTARSLTFEQTKIFNSIPVAEMGPCVSKACFFKKPFFTLELDSDPNWLSINQAYEEDLTSCWGYPLITMHGQIVGAINIFQHDRKEPTYTEEKLIQRQSQLAAIAMEQHQAETALVESEQRYRLLYDDTPSMFFTLDETGHIVMANQFSQLILGYQEEEFLGRSFTQFHQDEHKDKTQINLKNCIQNGDTVYRWEGSLRKSDGSVIYVRHSARLIFNPSKDKQILISSEDITETYNLSKQLAYQASHDALTNLVNRREFERRLSRLVDQARKMHSVHVLCYLDLDQFKVINDTSGHQAGDELLRQLGLLLPQKIRNRDTLARLGGDEFGILLEHCTLETAKKIADELLDTIRHFQFIWSDQSYTIGVSIGMVTITHHSSDLNTILRQADSACYAAKESGRNRIHIYQENDSEMAQRHGEIFWVQRLQSALETNQLRLYRQPICKTDSLPNMDLFGVDQPAIHHYEILLRLHDPKYDIVGPTSFLPAAERFNLSPDIDRWVVSETLNWMANSKSKDVTYSINLSGHSLSNKDFLQFLANEINQINFPHSNICFEITETAAIKNLSSATRFINELKALGCKFSLDDFGSGLSSFAYLKTLPIDYLKIDGLFVRDVEDDPIDLAMVKAINEMAHILGKQTIAEYVESDAILQEMKNIGVDYVQGYVIAEPEPLPEC